MAGEKTCRQPKLSKSRWTNFHACQILIVVCQEFVAGLALAPPTVQVDAALLEQYTKEMEDAANQPLPDEDDPDL